MAYGACLKPYNVKAKAVLFNPPYLADHIHVVEIAPRTTTYHRGIDPLLLGGSPL